MAVTSLDRAAIQQLRADYYNAVVVEVRNVNPSLRILRVRYDSGRMRFSPGQYTLLGLGAWEPSFTGGGELMGDEPTGRLLKRAYSISCSLVSDAGRVLRPVEYPYLEFYFNLVQLPGAPGLTPRLFMLERGSRLFVGARPRGRYTLAPVQPHHTVLFFSTGTGEAPHNAMLAELLATGHQGQILSVTCVRNQTDLGYLLAHRHLESSYPNYRYATLITREPENIDPTYPRYVGKRYLQQFVASGELERLLGAKFAPDATHAYLCGSPAMIGWKHHPDGHPVYPRPERMIEVLERRGFRADYPHVAGNLHFEKYW